MQRIALITGASTGIGYELSKLFAEDNHNLVLVARNQQRLNQIAEEFSAQFGVSVKVIAADLADPESSKRIYGQLEKEAIRVDFLVNNAGIGLGGPFAENDLNVELDIMQVNMVSLVHLTKLFLKDMLKQRYGKILNVASTAAFQAGPMMAIYYATKAFVLSFTEAIAHELKGTGVTVTALCPGPTQTEFQLRANIQNTRLARLSSMGLMKAEDVAKIGYREFLKGKRLVIPGLMNKVGAQAVRFAPRALAARVAGMLNV